MTTQLVEGEPLEALREALSEMNLTQRRGGRFHLTFSLEPRLGDPLMRAFRRIEAELLLHDAEMIGTPGAVERTYHQGAADAFVLLAPRITVALNAERAARSSMTTDSV